MYLIYVLASEYLEIMNMKLIHDVHHSSHVLGESNIP